MADDSLPLLLQARMQVKAAGSTWTPAGRRQDMLNWSTRERRLEVPGAAATCILLRAAPCLTCLVADGTHSGLTSVCCRCMTPLPEIFSIRPLCSGYLYVCGSPARIRVSLRPVKPFCCAATLCR